MRASTNQGDDPARARHQRHDRVLGKPPAYLGGAFKQILSALDAVHHTRGAEGNEHFAKEVFLVDDNGVWVHPSVRPRPWHPKSDTREHGGADPYEEPLLPFPFTANQLAAFMVDGHGALFVRMEFGNWENGPNDAAGHATGYLSDVAREAMNDAYTAFRDAAQTAKSFLPSTAQQLGDKLLQSERDKGHDIEKHWDVEELRDRFESARAQDPGAYRMWRQAIVRQLLSSAVRSQRPMQALRAQEEAVREKLVEMGHSPMALPPPKRGSSGVKAEVRTSIGKTALFHSDAVFNKTWQRLRDQGLIADA